MGGPKCNYENLKQKWIFFDLAKHGLIKTWEKSKFGLLFERPNRRDRERRGKERRKGRGREEEEKRSKAKLRYGTTWNSKVLYEFPCLYSY